MNTLALKAFVAKSRSRHLRGRACGPVAFRGINIYKEKTVGAECVESSKGKSISVGGVLGLRSVRTRTIGSKFTSNEINQ